MKTLKAGVFKKEDFDKVEFNRTFKRESEYSWEEVSEEEYSGKNRIWGLYYHYTHGKVPVGAVVSQNKDMKNFQLMMWKYNENFEFECGFLLHRNGEQVSTFRDLKEAMNVVEDCLIG